MRRILVTGGAGYIGSHVCKALSLAGYFPVTYDNLIHGHASSVLWGPLEEGDLTDYPRLVSVIRSHQVESVIHLAGFAYVGESVSQPDRYYENNVYGSLCLLQAMNECQLRKLVFSSTCAVYGTPTQVPIREDQKIQPVNPYGHTKAMVEQMLSDFHQAYGMSSIALRYFNAAGASPDGEIGEDHDPETHLIPLALHAAIQGESLTVFGTDYPTPDGTCIRDYIHVSDLAYAHVLATQALDQSHRGYQFYNLGIGKGYSVKEVIRIVEKVTGKKVPVILGARRPGDPPVLIADAKQAETELKWKPRFIDLEDIVATARTGMSSRKIH